MTRRLALEGKLRRALERDQFQLHYQSRVDLATGRILGAEALIRWYVPGEELILPEQFIPLAEETGLITTIGKWVLHAACAQNKAWQDLGLPPTVVSVNVSAQQFRASNFVRCVAETLAETRAASALSGDRTHRECDARCAAAGGHARGTQTHRRADRH
ncbi:MAG: EAL domain-containing protein [Steroidobacteraceae bacterium]